MALMTDCSRTISQVMAAASQLLWLALPALFGGLLLVGIALPVASQLPMLLAGTVGGLHSGRTA